MRPVVGDLVYDASIGQNGIVLESKLWENSVFAPFDGEDYEYVILYEDGELDSAYENEIEVINESR